MATLQNEFFRRVNIQQLVPWSFRCGHVIDIATQLRCIVLSHGPSGRALDFRASERAQPESMDELGRVLRNICATVGGGVVAFFPSYAYEAQCHARWNVTGLIARLRQLKPGMGVAGAPSIFSPPVAFSNAFFDCTHAGCLEFNTATGCSVVARAPGIVGTTITAGVFREADRACLQTSASGWPQPPQHNSVEVLLERYAAVVHAPGSKGALMCAGR